MGGMGAKEQNFHKNVFDRMGYSDLTDDVQRLFLSGQKDEAAALIPDELVHALHIIGDETHVKAKIKEWEASGVTTLVLSCRSPEEIAQVARVVLG